MTSLNFLVRESKGIFCKDVVFNKDDKVEGENLIKFEDENEVTFVKISKDGKFVAIAFSNKVNIYENCATATGYEFNLKLRIPRRLTNLQFSYNNLYIVGWEDPGKNTTHNNFTIWKLNVEDKDKFKVTDEYSIKLSKFPEFEISDDESIYARLMSNDKSLLFSKTSEFNKIILKTPENLKIDKFSLSPSSCNQKGQGDSENPLYVLCYIAANTSGLPSFARIYKYPNFENIIASKSFFQVDRVNVKWNLGGNALLLLATTDVDKTGQSYYGKSMLHYLDIKGVSTIVQIESDTTLIHGFDWNPANGKEFVVINGKMPNVRTVLLNQKCEVIFDFGVVARNSLYFNPQGNILILAGFGNIGHGNVEIWEILKHKKKIAELKAPMTTHLQWFQDGTHFITATTAPKRQIENNYKIWNLKGECLFKWEAEKFLFGINTIINTKDIFPVDASFSNLIDKIVNKDNANKKAQSNNKPSVYIPPSKRGIVGMNNTKSAASNNNANKPNQQSSQLTEKEKKIRAVKKKLEQIEKLKEQIKEGKPIEKNQQDKLKKEDELLDELKELEIS